MAANREPADTNVRVTQLVLLVKANGGGADLIVQGNDDAHNLRVLSLDLGKTLVPILGKQLLQAMHSLDPEGTLRILRATLEANEN